jgi:single-stranded DNA-binding protein
MTRERPQNRTVLIGRVKTEPQFLDIERGPYASFFMETKEACKDHDTGAIHQEEEVHYVVVLKPKYIELLQGNAKIGTKVQVEGRLKTRRWHFRTKNIKTTAVVIENYSGRLIILEKPPSKKQDEPLAKRPKGKKSERLFFWRLA